MGKPSKGSESAAKSDKKFEKKLEFYARVRDTVASLSANKEIKKKKKNQRSRLKKLKAFNLSSLAENLPDLNAALQSTQPVDLKLNCKRRQKLISEETKRLSTVLEDPSFKTDSLGWIHQHLLSKQPIVEEEPKKKVKKNGSQKRRNRKKKSRVSSEPHSMET